WLRVLVSACRRRLTAAAVDARREAWNPGRMAVPRLAIALLALLLAAGAASAAVAKGRNYDGAARGIALTAGQANYKALTASGTATKPSADKRRGYRSGWQVAYLKGTATKPVTAVAIIYVYKTIADAKLAYDNACKDCSGTYRTEGVSMKFQAIANGKTP